MAQITASRILLRSAARTVATACPKQLETSQQSLRVYLNVTAASGTGGLTLQVRGYDKASGNTAILLVAAAAVTATGMYVYEMLAGSASTGEGDVKHTAARPLPATWDINIAVGDASSYTYSVGADLSAG
jgi:hypothetical protein